jgi:hypothetical protein
MKRVPGLTHPFRPWSFSRAERGCLGLEAGEAHGAEHIGAALERSLVFGFVEMSDI